MVGKNVLSTIRNKGNGVIKKFGNYIIVVISIMALIGYLLYTEGIETIIRVFSNIQYRWIFFSLLSTIACWLADALILYSLSRSYGGQSSFRYIFRCARVGVMFGLISPLQSGMAPAQMIMLTKDGMRSGNVATVLLFKNILLLLATSLILGLFLYWKRAWVSTLNPWLFAIILGALVLNAFYLVILFSVGKAQRIVTRITIVIIRLLAKIRVVKRLEAMEIRAKQEIEHMNLNFNNLNLYSLKSVFLILLSIVQMVLFCQSTFFIYRAFGLVEHGYLTILAGQFFVFAIQSIIPIPGGLGIADGGFYLILNYIFGVQNINFALVLWRIFSFYLPIFMGMLLLFTYKRKVKKLGENLDL
jgi:glycosyltransferase 2 family protein